MGKKVLAVLLAAWMLLGLAGCGKGGGEAPEGPPVPESGTTAPAQGTEQQQPPQPEEPAGTNPLTGLPMEPEKENLRPVAVMLNNIKAAQPQLGVSKADILYEVPTEGGITRMLAVYQSLEDVGDLGSIRSTRTCFLELALGHDALLVHAGGSPEAYRNISSWKVNNMDGVQGGERGDLFWRDKERQRTMGYEHSLLTSGETIQGYLDGGHYRTEHEAGYAYGQTFSDEDNAQGETAEHVTLRFTNYKTGLFDYDSYSGRYLASQYGAPYVDGANSTQVSAVNVLVLETDISLIPGDDAGRLKVRLTGDGEGTYFHGGKAVPIHWSKADRNSPFVYTKEDGAPLSLAPGNSYVCIMSPKTGTLSYE